MQIMLTESEYHEMKAKADEWDAQQAAKIDPDAVGSGQLEEAVKELITVLESVATVNPSTGQRIVEVKGKPVDVTEMVGGAIHRARQCFTAPAKQGPII